MKFPFHIYLINFKINYASYNYLQGQILKTKEHLYFTLNHRENPGKERQTYRFIYIYVL